MKVVVDIDEISLMLESLENPFETRDAVISYLAEECMDLDLYLMRYGCGQPRDEVSFYRDLYEDMDEEDDFDDDWDY